MLVKDFPRIKALIQEVEQCDTFLNQQSFALGGHNGIEANAAANLPRKRELHAAVITAVRAYRKEVIADLKALDAPVEE